MDMYKTKYKKVRRKNILNYKWITFLYDALRIKKTMLANLPTKKLSPRITYPSFVGRSICRHGIVEKENTEFVMRDVKLRDGDIAIDVGANIGWYSLILDKISAGSSAQIFAFEPNAKTYELLIENLRINDASSVIGIQKGLSDVNETKIMYLNNKNIGQHSLLPLAGQNRTEEIETVTLNDYFKQKNLNPEKLKFIKMDIEGFELMALRGATTLLKTCPLIMLEYSPHLMAECNFRPQDLLDLMTENNYQAHYLIRGELHEAKKASLLYEQQIDVFWRKIN